MFLENYQFKYPWRKYQANVLAELEQHMQDNQLNIVAAPGSGKTILGLEVVRRLNKNVLILSPTITIKKQWVDRFLTLFVGDHPAPDFISTDIYDLKRFNVATYQGLHFAYRRKKIFEETISEEEEGTSTNIRGTNIDYDLIAELLAKKIEVIVLDEAHHLRSAWWKSLTDVLQSLPDIKTISLTATPPYDVDKSEWEKYVQVCGPIDSEISVPELVATKDLCPHQDFVIFNKLSKEEEKTALNIQGRFHDYAEKLQINQDLIKALASKPELNHYASHEEKILENPKYYSSLLIFLHAVGEKVNQKMARALGGGKNIPALTMEWLEIMLQGVLFDDHELLLSHPELLKDLRDDLNKIGGIEKKRVMIQNNSELKKLMASSVGKMASIVEIARREYACLQADLSMVVLTDYIRMEALGQEKYNKIGVIPIFKKIIAAKISPNVAILTGGLKVIPVSLMAFVQEKLPECDFYEIDISGYVSIKIREKYKNQLVGIITEAVNEKKINIVIGTVALLGEGWDCQAVNSLVLASFVGSFMLSNQMRGRAIRHSKNDPTKVANIWHLASITRHDYGRQNLFAGLDLSDYRTLKRRFRGFVGIAYTENLIQNGLERLEMVPEQNLLKEHEQVNQNMYQLAKRRDETRRRWQEILALFGDEAIKIVNTLEGKAAEERFMTFASYDLQNLILGLLAMIALSIWYFVAAAEVSTTGEILAVAIGLAISLWEFYFIGKLIGRYNPVKNMSKVAAATLIAMQELGVVQTPSGLVSSRVEKTKVNWDQDRTINIYSTKLHGATVYENNLYIKCVQEIYQRIDNPRYLIMVRNRVNFRTSYFNVPTIFAVNKTNAEIFYQHWKKRIGKGKLVYTRNQEGRKALLDARKGSFDYNEKFFERKRAVKQENWQ